jgi:putative endonuclease
MKKTMEERQYYVYIMTNKVNTVFYTGVTNDLIRRVIEHKTGTVPGFTAKYRLSKLVYYEVGNSIEGAILREKQIKAGSRQDKINLIVRMNQFYRDLFDDFQ